MGGSWHSVEAAPPCSYPNHLQTQQEIMLDLPCWQCSVPDECDMKPTHLLAPCTAFPGPGYTGQGGSMPRPPDCHHGMPMGPDLLPQQGQCWSSRRQGWGSQLVWAAESVREAVQLLHPTPAGSALGCFSRAWGHGKHSAPPATSGA